MTSVAERQQDMVTIADIIVGVWAERCGEGPISQDDIQDVLAELKKRGFWWDQQEICEFAERVYEQIRTKYDAAVPAVHGVLHVSQEVIEGSSEKLRILESTQMHLVNTTRDVVLRIA